MAHFFAICGDRGRGKTTALGQVVQALRKSGISVGGFLQPAVGDNGPTTGYQLMSLESGEIIPFARKGAPKPADGLGYEFQELGWGFAARQLLNASTQVLIVDELGRLEAQGGGHLPALKAAIPSRPARVYIFSVRRDCLAGIQAALDISIKAYPVAEKEKLTQAVLEIFRKEEEK